MSSFTSGIGIASGINIGALVEQMLAAESRRQLPLQARLLRVSGSRAAIQQSQALLLALRSAATALAQPSTISATAIASSAPSILTAIAGAGTAAVGSTSLLVRAIARSSHIVSHGIESTAAALGADALTLRMGSGRLADDRLLSQLRGGNGITAGRIRITDRSGQQATIDLRHALSIGDVLQEINSAAGIDVEARLSSDGRSIEIVDRSQGSGTLSVKEWGGGTTAASLGIVGNDTDGDGVIAGSTIAHLGASTALSTIGTGVPNAGGAADFMIVVNGIEVPVSLGAGPGGSPPAAATLGDALARINTALEGAGVGDIARVSIAPDGDRLRLTATGTASIAFVPPPGLADGAATSATASALGALGLAGLSLEQSGTGSSSARDGARILFGMQDVGLAFLNAGAGLSLSDSLTITDRAGRTVTVSGLASVDSISGVIARIREAAAAVPGMDLDVGLDASGTRLRIADRGGGAGAFSINGAAAQQLGFSVQGASSVAISKDLRRADAGLGTPLASLAGAPVSGSFRITNRAGASATIAVSSSMSVADLARAIDSANLGVRLRINSWGDAIELVDESGGPGSLTVTDTQGGAASALRIAGSSSAGRLDGTRTRQLALTGSESATELAAMIDALEGVDARLEVDDDGNSYLSIRGLATGARNDLALVVDGADLGFASVVRAGDARVIVSPENGGTLVTSATNLLTGVIAGVSLELQHASADAVTVTVYPSNQPIQSAVAAFASALGAALAQLRQATAVDPDAGTRGPLYGNLTASRTREALRSLVGSVFGPDGRRLSRLGITISGSGTVQFDPAVLDAALEADPDAVRSMLADSQGVAQRFDAALGAFVDPNGALGNDDARLARVADSANATIDRLNAGLVRRRAVLLARFAAMEAAIGQLQNQQASLQSLLSSFSS